MKYINNIKEIKKISNILSIVILLYMLVGVFGLIISNIKEDIYGFGLSIMMILIGIYFINEKRYWDMKGFILTKLKEKPRE